MANNKERAETGESSRGSHRVQTLARCPRAYGYAYLLGLEPAKKGRALSLGAVTHQGLEALYSGRDWTEALMRCSAEDAAAVPDALNLMAEYTKQFHVYQDDRGRVFERYQGEDREVMFVEREFELVTTSGQKMTRRLDLGLKRPDTSLIIVDHKTASRPDKRVQRTDIEIPLLTQALFGPQIAKDLGCPWGEFQLGLIGTGSAKGHNDRVTLWYTKTFLAQAEASLNYWLELEGQLSAAWSAGRLDPWALAMTFSCYPGGYACPYQALCRDGEAALRLYTEKGEG
jgi:hypothetical protein